MRRALIVAAAWLLIESVSASAVQAGPLLDWWRSRPRLFGNRNQPVTVEMPAVTAYSPAVTSGATTVTALSPQTGACSVSCPVQTVQRVAVSYVPKTSYRSHWVQTPVTSYRPQTTTDPVTGCQVTCVKPCTTYRWQLRRIPYTTYRPVYQTVSVQMPAVTDCGSCAVPMATTTTQALAPTAGTFVQPGIVQSGVVQPGIAQPGMIQPGMIQPGMAQPGYSGGASGQSILNGGGLPADQQPTLNGANRIVIPGTYDPATGQFTPDPNAATGVTNGAAAGNGAANPNGNGAAGNGNANGGNSESNGGMGTNSRMPQRLETPASAPNSMNPMSDPNPGSRTPVYTAPPIGTGVNQTAGVTLRHKWDYSPIKLASYERPIARQPVTQPAPVDRQPATPAINQGWQSVRPRL